MSTASKDDAGWQVAYTIAGPGEKTITFQTENKFVDANTRVTLNTPAASTLTLNLANNTGSLSMGTATDGVYSPTATFTGTASIEDAGWISSGNHNVSDANIIVGKVNQSTISNGVSPVPSGSTVTPGPSEQVITISEGYNTARTLTIGSASSSSPGEITSGTATIDTLSYTFDSTNTQFNISGSGDISAPTIDTAGYISGTVGTLNGKTNGATVAATVAQIALNSTLTGATSARKPTLSKQAISITGVTDAANGSATSTAPSTGAYVAVRSAANTSTITSAPTVYTDGYGTTTNFSVNNAATATVGAAQSDIYYIPIKPGTVTSGTANITSTAIAYNSSNGNFNITGSADVSAPTFTEGYIGTNVGTKNGNTGGATLTSTLGKIGISAAITGTGTYKPSIAKHSDTNISVGTVTTTKPSSGYYIAVNSAANTGNITATPTVSSAGYGTTTTGQYSATTDNLTVGAQASNTTYVPIPAALLANTATSGTTYTDTSSSAPVLISNDYLYINGGYITDQKISLAKLVPDHGSVDLAADYILSGYSAYNNDGVLIAGSIQTYDGTYTIV